MSVRFRARARTVDLLGRQQIADIPTAVHELFKNAHDAYAESVTADYFQSQRLLVVRDDGIGMTRQDFEHRWLVLGTESKVSGAVGERPLVDPSKRPRPVLGEKGIGRLAIGIMGDAVLILTRAKRPNSTSLVAAFVHWGVFASPGIDLEDISIPVVDVPDASSVDAGTVDTLVTSFRKGLKDLLTKGVLSTDSYDAIETDLRQFAFDPQEAQAYLGEQGAHTLGPSWTGTQFWILPANNTLDNDLRSERRAASRMEQQLLGFADTMSPSGIVPAMSTSFFHHGGDGSVRNVINKDAFFTPNEFENADHFISGHIDMRGMFTGTVSVFGERYDQYAIPYHETGGRPIACGPFQVHLAYVQGARRDSTLPDEQWMRFTEKAERIGGVYVYRDGIRVLPYGNVDYDWLEIEERRSRSASYYFFSHRRMCGAVLLTRAENSSVVEKAGREGFIRNKAYRDLTAVVQNLLVRLAAEFFRKEGHGEHFQEAKKRLARENAARQKRLASVRPRQRKLQEELSEFFDGIETERFIDEIAQIRGEFDQRISGSLQSGSADEVDLAGKDARSQLSEVRRQYTVVVPQVPLTRDLATNLRRYRTYQASLETTHAEPLERYIEEALANARAMLGFEVDLYAALWERVQHALSDARAEFQKARTQVSSATEELRRNIDSGLRERAAAQTVELKAVEKRTSVAASTLTSAESLGALSQSLVGQVNHANARLVEELDRMAKQVASVQWEASDDVLAQLAAVEQEASDLRERLDEELEAAQVGMAIEVLSHEFDHHINDIRTQIRALGVWADANPAIRELHDSLRVAFEHLDGYLTLFTPLRRRLYRSTTQISGRDISRYIQRLFGRRLQDAGVRLIVEDDFKAAVFVGYPSTYFPVFVNLVDNAIYWASNVRDAEIRLFRRGNALGVADSGPGIDLSDQEAVFDRGFSLKPEGRGLGLTIARDSVKKAGGRLRIGESKRGAVFLLEIAEDAWVLE